MAHRNQWPRHGWPGRTGSGKTLAFTALWCINARPIPKPGDGPFALVLAPTRELAGRSARERTLRAPMRRTLGVHRRRIAQGAAGAAASKGTGDGDRDAGAAGRLLAAKRSDLASCTYLVLDEADRVNLGRAAIRALIGQMRRERQRYSSRPRGRPTCRRWRGGTCRPTQSPSRWAVRWRWWPRECQHRAEGHRSRGRNGEAAHADEAA